MTACVIVHGPTHHTDRGLVCDNHRRRIDMIRLAHFERGAK